MDIRGTQPGDRPTRLQVGTPCGTQWERGLWSGEDDGHKYLSLDARRLRDVDFRIQLLYPQSTRKMAIKELNGHAATNGLRVLIVGAGIGGLTAAIALRQQGHRVEVSFMGASGLEYSQI